MKNTIDKVIWFHQAKSIPNMMSIGDIFSEKDMSAILKDNSSSYLLRKMVVTFSEYYAATFKKIILPKDWWSKDFFNNISRLTPFGLIELTEEQTEWALEYSSLHAFNNVVVPCPKVFDKMDLSERERFFNNLLNRSYFNCRAKNCIDSYYIDRVYNDPAFLKVLGRILDDFPFHPTDPFLFTEKIFNKIFYSADVEDYLKTRMCGYILCNLDKYSQSKKQSFFLSNETINLLLTPEALNVVFSENKINEELINIYQKADSNIFIKACSNINILLYLINYKSIKDDVICAIIDNIDFVDCGSFYVLEKLLSSRPIVFYEKVDYIFHGLIQREIISKTSDDLKNLFKNNLIDIKVCKSDSLELFLNIKEGL